jgi:dTDP-glucose 4,6-dehydratase
MKVLVTGAAGFIGSNLVHYLVAERPSWDIVSLDLLTYAGNLENIASLVDENKTRFVKLDICDEQGIEQLFAQESFDIVFHLAAESHVDRSIHGAKDFIRTNVLGTQTLLDAAKHHGVKKFIHISTDEVYGSLGPTGRFYETTPLDPSSPYSASKAASDLVALAFGKTHSMHVCVTRCTNNYGPYQFPEKLIPLFITNLLENKKIPLYGDGMNVRSWLYVTDHCEAILLVGEKGVAGEVYNIGGTEEAEIPNRQVTDAILTLLGKDASLIEWVADRPAHDRRYAVSIDKIHAAFGWKPRVAFADGLARTVAWYQQHAAWWQHIKSGEYMRFYEMHYGNKR